MRDSTYFYFLHPDEYIQGLRYYLFAVDFDRPRGCSNTINDLSNRACVSNITEDLNLHVCDMVTRINESKTLTKHISCKYKFKFDGKKCNRNQKWNNNKC